MSTGTGSSIGALRVHFLVEEDVDGEFLLLRRLRVCGLLGDLTITTENDCDGDRFFGTAYIVVI